MPLAAIGAGMDMPAEHGRAAGLHGPEGASLRRTQRRFGAQEVRQERTQGRDDRRRGGHRLRLAWQAGAEILDEAQRVLLATVGEVQIDLSRVDVGVTEQGLDGVQARAAFDEVRGEGMAQRMHGGIRQVELLARDEHEALQGTHRHRRGGAVHAKAELRAVIVATACVGEQQQRMPMKGPVAAQVFEHVRRQRHNAVVDAWAASRLMHPSGCSFLAVCLSPSQGLRLPPLPCRTRSFCSLPTMSWIVRLRHSESRNPQQ